MTRPDGSPESEAPPSIASLRSKFESLAEANNTEKPTARPFVVPKPNGLRVDGAGLGSTVASGSASSPPFSRPNTPVPPKPPKPASISNRSRFGSLKQSSVDAVNDPTQHSPAPTAPKSPSPHSERQRPSSSLSVVAPKPVIVSTPASPAASPPPAESTRTRAISDVGPSSSGSSPALPMSPKLLRRPPPAVPRAASPQASVESDFAPSVKALRERYSKASGDPSLSETLGSEPEAIPISESSRPRTPDPNMLLSVTPAPIHKLSGMGGSAPLSHLSQSPQSSRRNSLQASPRGSRPGTPSEQPSLAPPLPDRKQATSSSAGNGTAVDSPSSLLEKPPLPVDDLPPRLPPRSRAQTSARPEDARPIAPPPLPSRNATLPGSLPTTQSAGIAASLEKSEYQPPPPPSRSIISPPRKDSKEIKADLSSEDEEEDDPAPLSNLSAAAKRAFEDTPDATHANRRPPNFVPNIRVALPSHIFAFAVHGRHLATGAHHVRVYDTQMSERPVFIVELRETGLDFRIKDPKVTALAFRPGALPCDEGRYLWCGTKDGHLWELDIKTGKVTDTRAAAHSAAVIQIFRYKQQILTLDEGGKLLVYEVPIQTSKESSTKPHLVRSIRVTERFTFAMMTQDKLWISTARAARSTTTVSSKGPTIRIYEPCTAGSAPPAKPLFTTEWTGAVTAATILPLQPETAYLGHEGGFVSIWSVKEQVCLQVLKISVSDILSLEGVGEKLWAGNRKGQIHVYDISERPWRVTNLWSAHSDHPITMLLTDPWSIEQTGRYAIWSTTRESVSAWDGLLSVDWIDCQMTLRQRDYSDYREVKALICSWNIDSAKPTDLVGSEANVNFFDQLLDSVDCPDIIVFGLQEVIPLTDKRLTAKNLLFGGKNKEAGVLADKVSSAYRHWLDKLTSAIRKSTPEGVSYSVVLSESLVGLFTAVFVRTEMKDSLRALDICTVKRGLGNIYGNKGAIVARMVLDDTSLCFINVHLAAGQSQKAARNADLAGIMEDKAILPESEPLPFVYGGNGTAILDHELVILNGDLNYRIDQRREMVLSSISAGDLAHLLDHDQLRKEMRGNRAFRLLSFEEAPITFAPTYKFNRGSTEYDTSEKNRIPAWCDRILYSRTPCIEPINYKRYETTISDHRPISAGFRLKVKSVDKERMSKVRAEVGAEWIKHEIEMLEKMVGALQELV